MESLLAAGLLEDLGINPRVLGTQVVIFVITFLVLSRLLFGRVLATMREREGEARKAREAIEKDRAEVERLSREMEDRLARIDREAYDRMQATLKEALASAAGIVAGAQAQARKDLDEAHATIRREKQSAAAGLRAEVTRLTLGVVEKLLDTKLDPATHGAAVRSFVERS
jgi:F-type H+-transporting ATPase subunit b